MFGVVVPLGAGDWLREERDLGALRDLDMIEWSVVHGKREQR